MRLLRAAFLLGVIVSSPAVAEPPVDIPEANLSIKVATGNTYQAIVPALPNPPQQSRRSITIENNNATDICEIDVTGAVAIGDTTATAHTIGGVSLTAIQASIRLLPGGSWQRYYPFIPSNAIVGTCDSTGDSLYVSGQ
jgi:hypothetical protein